MRYHKQTLVAASALSDGPCSIPNACVSFSVVPLLYRDVRCRMGMRFHKQTLVATHTFWWALLNPECLCCAHRFTVMLSHHCAMMCRMVMRFHKQALVAARTFWRALLNPEVSFSLQASLLEDIQTARRMADKTYKRCACVYMWVAG